MFYTFVYYRSFNIHNTEALNYFLQGNLVYFNKTKKNMNNGAVEKENNRMPDQYTPIARRKIHVLSAKRESQICPN